MCPTLKKIFACNHLKKPIEIQKCKHDDAISKLRDEILKDGGVVEIDSRYKLLRSACIVEALKEKYVYLKERCSACDAEDQKDRLSRLHVDWSGGSEGRRRVGREDPERISRDWKKSWAIGALLEKSWLLEMEYNRTSGYLSQIDYCKSNSKRWFRLCKWFADASRVQWIQVSYSCGTYMEIHEVYAACLFYRPPSSFFLLLVESTVICPTFYKAINPSALPPIPLQNCYLSQLHQAQYPSPLFW